MTDTPVAPVEEQVETLAYLHEFLPGLNIDYSRYWESERDVIEPALKEAGWTDISTWWSPEKDSFGPLSRAVKATDPEGQRCTVWYG